MAVYIVVSTLDLTSDPKVGGLRPGLGCHVVPLDKKLYSTLSLSTQGVGGVGTDDKILGLILG